jgi:hypothetical protein
MKKITTLLMLVLATSLGWQASAQTGGDTCANALVVTPGTYSDAFITDGTAGASQPNAADAIWYSYTPVESGTIDINSCASDPDNVDTRLFIYTDGCATLTPVANNDDGCDAPNGFGSLLTAVSVAGGQEYLIEWDDRWEDTNPFDWELIFTPDPTVLPDCASNFAPADGTIDTGLTVVLTWDAPAAGAPVDSYDVLFGTDMAALTLNSNVTGLTETIGGLSLATQYFWQIVPKNAAGDAAGCDITSFTTATGVPPGEACSVAIVVTPGIINDVFITSDSGGGSQDSGNGDALWYSYTPVESGTININSCISDPGGVDTRLFVYTDGCATLTPVANDDDGCDAPNGFGSTLEEVSVIGGQEYLIEWDDRWEDTNPFDWELVFTPPPTCPEPANVTIATNAFDADISWDGVSEATNGYIVSVFAAGDDPMVDPPIYTENVATGSLMTTATGLTPETNYEAYVTADCEVGISLADANFFTTLVACPAPSNFTVGMITETDAVFNWDVVAEAINGYTLNVFDTGADPMVDPAVYTETLAAGIITATATGLMEDSGYDAYLVSDCDANGLSQENLLSFTTPFPGPECGGLFLDSGGSAGNYSPNESTITTITPDVPGEAVTVTFTYVDMETGGPNGGCWDYLTVYDGPDTTFPVLALTLCGEESGDGGQAGEPGSVLSIGDSFTSSDASGALTFVFTSDGSIQETGWSADVTCAIPPVGCGDVYYDTGGETGDYMPSEIVVTTISPDTAGDVVTVTFTYVDIESSTGAGSQEGCWDFLTVYDGPDTTFPVLAMTLCGEESGDGGEPGTPTSLLSIGDSFTSSDASGALTFVFTSDTSVEETGWAADVTCGPVVLPCPDVENFAISSITGTTAELTWDAATGAVSYDWSVFLSGADPDVDDPINFELATTATSGLAQGLIPETAYDAYIRTNCMSNASDGVGPVAFQTTELGVNDIDVNAFVFAPNPTSGMVTIQSGTMVSTINIVNMLGQSVLTISPNSDNFTLDLTRLTSGAYFMNATVNGITITKKLIKE